MIIKWNKIFATLIWVVIFIILLSPIFKMFNLFEKNWSICSLITSAIILALFFDLISEILYHAQE